MEELRRYYCIISADVSLNAGNLPKQSISALNEKIEEAISDWAKEIDKKGLSADVQWQWSEGM